MGVSFVHISCHGETETSQRVKMGNLHYDAYLNQGDYMLFEDQLGNSQPVSLKNMQDLMKTVMLSAVTLCVFLAGCFSQNHG